MKKNMEMYYDKEGDFLEIVLGSQRKGRMKNVGKGIFHRIDEKTGKVVGVAIFSFRKRVEK